MSYVADWMREDLKDHIWESRVTVTDASGEIVFLSGYLGTPGTRRMSTLITFTPEGIVLQGDLTPERNGSISAHGYGAKWFAGELSESYLCSKFIEKRFSPERALDVIKRELIEARKKGTFDKEEARLHWDRIEGWGEEALTPEDYAILYESVFYNWPEETPMDYDEGEAGWLCAIQQRFKEAYQKQKKTPLLALSR